MRRYLQAFFRHPVLLTLPIVLALAASVGYQMRQPRSFQAALTMWCDAPVPQQSTIFAGAQQQPSAAQAAVVTELLQTRAFLAKVAQHGPWASSPSSPYTDTFLFGLGAKVSVATPGPHVLSISTKGASADEALALAKSVSDQYIAEVNDTQRTRAQSSVGFYQLQLNEASKALATAQDKLNKYLQANQGSGPLGALVDATAAQLTQAVSVAQSNYDQASSHYTDAGLSLSNAADSGVLRIFDAPRAASAPVGRKKKIIFSVVAGLFAGVMISFFTLLLLVVGDRSVHGSGDIEDVLGMQVVGTIDQFKTKRRRRNRVS